ncbi:zf-HC2 domain-containing protein [Actinocrispum sp. NPDC049592]|uniref:zf-HC2 domain-containing protein n=1 Tax=Actinocrispum sp. NPDC049592 TaxID=3154835 RepID=UPI0034314DAA
MSEIGCAQVRELGAEFALGILDGRQRAELMSHLEGCDGCRDELRQLAEVRDELLTLVPAGEPPLGFESRVLRSLGRTKRRQWLRPVAAAVALLIALAGGWLLGSSRPDSLVNAELTAGGRVVGHAFLYTHSPSWVYMTVAGVGDEVSCQVGRADGSWATTGSFSLRNGYGYWGGPAKADPGSITAIRLVRSDGTVLAEATLPAR